MKKSLCCSLALAGAALCLTNVAAASSYMLTAMQNPVMGVVDLTPEDGIAAGFDLLHNDVDLTATVNIGPVYTQATASTGGGASASYSSFRASVYDRTEGLRGAASVGQPMQGADKVSFATNAGISIMLAPHSMFTYSGEYSFYVSGDNVNDYRIYTDLNITLGEGWGPATTWSTSGTSNFTKRFWLGYANDTDSAQEIRLGLKSTGYFAARPAMLAAVPEPSSYLLLLAGLSLLGCAARRRRA